MAKISFSEVEQSIKTSGWFHFGNDVFECPGLGKEEIEFYIKNSKLPPPCDKCYKALIFWEDSYSEENVRKFFDMVDSFEVEYAGKLNEGVVVFYFRDKSRMLEFIEFLENKMQEYDVKGKTQWRRACREYQILKPELWKNAKEFLPDALPKTLTSNGGS
jgi:hypothetical protein